MTAAPKDTPSKAAPPALLGGPRRAMQTTMALASATVRRWLRLARLSVTQDPGAAVDQQADLARADALFHAAADLKGGTAKVAQLMAYLEDPELATAVEARAVLAGLFDHIPNTDPAGVRKVLQEDLGAPPEALFAAWEEQPFAAASLGQVHGARNADGEELAVKVQYPGVAAALLADLGSDTVLRRLPGAAMGDALSPAALAAVRAAVLREVDYAAEAENLSRFRRLFREDEQMVFPRLDPARSTRRVLTAGRLRGQSVQDFAARASPGDRAAAAGCLFRFGFGAPLVHGVFNADPNPGNYLILPGAPPRVGYLDFGCCAELPEDLLTIERVLWQSLLAEDGESLRLCLNRAGLVEQAIEFESTRYREWEQLLVAPFRAHRFTWTAAYARAFCAHTSALVRGRRFTLPPAAVLLWRQRLGLCVVIGQLGATLDFRELLLALLRSVDMAPGGVR